jgi:hypothetical protein
VLPRPREASERPFIGAEAKSTISRYSAGIGVAFQICQQN